MLPDYIQKTLNDALKENYFDELKAAFQLNKTRLKLLFLIIF